MKNPTGNFYTVRQLIDDLNLIEDKDRMVPFASGRDSAGKEFSRPIYKTAESADEKSLFLYLGDDCDGI